MSTTSVPEHFWKYCIEGNVNKIHEIYVNGGCTDVNLGLTGGCRGHQPYVVETMIKYGAQYCGNCDKSIKEHME